MVRIPFFNRSQAAFGFLIIAILVILGLAVGHANAASIDRTLMISRNADRSSAQPLANHTLSHADYVFINNRPGLSNVAFSLDGTEVSNEYLAPFDFNRTAADGTAYSYDFPKLTPGHHTISYVMTVNGVVTSGQATFTTLATPVTQPASGAFVHPGILVDGAQLADVKAKIAAKQEPWYSAYNSMARSSLASTSYTPHPVASVGFGTNKDEGATAERTDSQAAYTDALIWAYTGDTAHRDEALKILDAWSAKLKSHKADTSTYNGGWLNAAWGAETFTKAAEIMRYTNSGWSASNISRFETMLNTAYMPLFDDPKRQWGANWEYSIADATIEIGVFTNNRTTYNTGVTHMNDVIKKFIYMNGDTKPAWNNVKTYTDGLEGETCRDLGHDAMGLSSMFMGSQTASLQGTDLFGPNQARMSAAMEYQTKYILNRNAPGWDCGTAPVDGGVEYWLTWEIGYNHLHNVDGVSLPNTKALLSSTSPKVSSTNQDAWELLTNGGRL